MELTDPIVTELQITSIVPHESSTTIAGDGVAGKYGDVFFSWELTPRGDGTVGTFTGNSRALMTDGNFISAYLQGTYRRDGVQIRLFSLDLGSNGDQNFVDVEVDVREKTARAKLYGLS